MSIGCDEQEDNSIDSWHLHYQYKFPFDVITLQRQACCPNQATTPLHSGWHFLAHRSASTLIQMVVLSVPVPPLLVGYLDNWSSIHRALVGSFSRVASPGVISPWGQFICRCLFIGLPGNNLLVFVCESYSDANNWRRGTCIPARVGMTGNWPWSCSLGSWGCRSR